MVNTDHNPEGPFDVSLARALTHVLAAGDRALLPMLERALAGERTALITAGRGVALRNALLEALTAAGYGALATSVAIEAVDEMGKTVLADPLAADAAGFVRQSPTKFRALARLRRENLFAVGEDVSAALWESLAESLFTVRDPREILADLELRFPDATCDFDTLFDTQVSIYARQVEALASANRDADQPYIYSGPVDGTVRPWCLNLVGKVYTRDVIEAMDNGQLANPFLTGGGYNCRHSWLAVQSDEMRGLVNTGRRAPGYDADVARVEAWRAR